MGSVSDWETMKFCVETLKELKISYEHKVISAHRTPDLLYKYSKELENSSFQIVIAGAGGAAHLPGMIASLTILPVLGVPIESKILNGVDSLLSIVQMPAGVPVATFAIGKAGAINSALFACEILGLKDLKLKKNLSVYRNNQTQKIMNSPLPG